MLNAVRKWRCWSCDSAEGTDRNKIEENIPVHARPRRGWSYLWLPQTDSSAAHPLNRYRSRKM